ncbi:MAG: hypothetical protein JW789_00345 [Candidatus Aenigmarchaeota archaeon]|nr:hypothetical protein [Candidatus Aenigmarchaeota archaeon]
MNTENNRSKDESRLTYCDSCNEHKLCTRYDIEYTDIPRIGIYGNPISESPDLCDSCMDIIILEPFRKMSLQASGKG